MSNQKGFSKIAIIIIILILIGGAYFVFSKDGNSLTDDWKTYTHEKTDDYSFPKKFSIKYPPNAKMEIDIEYYPSITINFQENDASCSMISPPKGVGNEGSDIENISKKIMIGSRTWEESIFKDPDVGIVFYGLSSTEIPINFDLTPNEDELYKCLPMYKKILSTIEVVQ